MDATEAVARWSAVTGEPHELVGPLGGGETGATAIRRRGDGVELVLKWEADPTNQGFRRNGVVVAERLRTEAGWPVPVQRAVDDGDWLFVAQQFMPGEPIAAVTDRLVDDVLALHGRRLGLAADADTSGWAEVQVDLLCRGGHGYAQHEPLQRHDDRTRRVVERIEAIGRALVPGDLAGHDLVHADLHAGNLLAIDGALSAVVDVDYATVGDATFDLVFFAVASLDVPAGAGVRERLLGEVLGPVDETRRVAYSANVVLRALDWAIRKHRAADIELWLAAADRLL